MRRRTALVPALLLAVGLTGCALPAQPEPAAAPAPARAAAAADAPAPAYGPDSSAALIATVRRGGLALHASAGGPSAGRQGAATEEGTRQRLLVLRDEGDWLQVALPGRPNGRSAWARAGDVDLSATDWRLTVSLSKRTLEVQRGHLTTSTHRIAVGRPGTPTPTGTFWVTDLLRPPDPDGPYGPFAFGLSAYSDVVTSFGGGKGQVGLHGTDVPASIGTAASSGCLRLPDDVVRSLAGQLPLGTPVLVSA